MSTSNAILDRDVEYRVGDLPRRRSLLGGYLSIVIALLVVGGFLAVVRLDRAPATATACSPAAVMSARLDQLGRSRYTWTISTTPLLDDFRGRTYFDRREVLIAPKVTCDYMTSVVNHEWAHVQQDRRYPGHAEEAFGAKLEIVADCASMLLGSTYTPYIDRQRHETGGGCSEYELQSAQQLIADAGH